MLTRTISGRLTLWYTLVLVIVLTAAGGALYVSQQHVRQARLEQDLQNTADTVVVSVNAEIDEGDSLQEAVADQLRELLLPGRAFALYDSTGSLLGARWEGLTPDALDRIGPRADRAARALHVQHHTWRILQARHDYRGVSYWLVVGQPLASLAREREALRDGLLLTIPIAILLAAAGGWWLSRQALRPLSTMAAQAREITEHDPGSRLIGAAAGDELGTFARAFNDLLGRLDTALRAQRQFMADASHELRTPVSVARTAAEVTLDSSRPSEPDYREALQTVASQMRRLTRMVDQMLVLAHADAGTRPLEPGDVYLDELVEECASTARLLARPSVTVAWRAPRDLEIRGDEELLRRMLLNLLENAVRHCRDGGTVSMAAERTMEGANVVVTDEGPGVLAADAARIFERFVRLDAARSGSGVGLGLPIARWVAEAHGGALTLERSGPNGSTFLVQLPASMLAAGPVEAA